MNTCASNSDSSETAEHDPEQRQQHVAGEDVDRLEGLRAVSMRAITTQSSPSISSGAYAVTLSPPMKSRPTTGAAPARLRLLHGPWCRPACSRTVPLICPMRSTMVGAIPPLVRALDVVFGVLDEPSSGAAHQVVASDEVDLAGVAEALRLPLLLARHHIVDRVDGDLERHRPGDTAVVADRGDDPHGGDVEGGDPAIEVGETTTVLTELVEIASEYAFDRTESR